MFGSVRSQTTISALAPGASRPMSSRPSSRAAPIVAAWNTRAVEQVWRGPAARRAMVSAVRISSIMFWGWVSVPMAMLTPASM